MQLYYKPNSSSSQAIKIELDSFDKVQNVDKWKSTQGVFKTHLLIILTLMCCDTDPGCRLMKDNKAANLKVATTILDQEIWGKSHLVNIFLVKESDQKKAAEQLELIKNLVRKQGSLEDSEYDEEEEYNDSDAVTAKDFRILSEGFCVFIKIFWLIIIILLISIFLI